MDGCDERQVFYISEYRTVVYHPWDVREAAETSLTLRFEPRRASACPHRDVWIVWVSGHGGLLSGAAVAADGLV